LGVGEVAARLPAALAAVATVVLTAALGTILIGRPRALVAAVVVATAPIMLVFGRLAIFDAPLTALVTAALYCLVRGRLDGSPSPARASPASCATLSSTRPCSASSHPHAFTAQGPSTSTPLSCPGRSVSGPSCSPRRQVRSSASGDGETRRRRRSGLRRGR